MWTSNDFLAPKFSKTQNYDTVIKKQDTKILRLYKVNNTYYFRKRFKKKLYRISLQTKNIKEALRRKKFLELLGEELFNYETKDFKILFEYDTEEEFRLAMELYNQIKTNEAVERYKTVKAHLEEANQNTSNSELNFTILRDKFIANKIKNEKVGEKSITAYNGTFNLLIKYFKDKSIHDLKIDDYEGFQKHLRTDDKMNKTVNKHINYLKSFLKFAKARYLITVNHADAVESLDEKKDEIARKKLVKNYTDAEVKKILNFKYKDNMYNTIFKIALYSGMRQGDIRDLRKENIRKEDDVYFFDILDAKSIAGIREVPIHRDILQEVLAFDFNRFAKETEDSFSKKCRYNLYKAIQSGENKTFQTMRGTFIAKALHSNLHYSDNNIGLIVQEIVGHAKEDGISLTFDTYGKNFPLSVKQTVIDSVNYS